MKKIFIFLFLAISSLSFAQPGWVYLNPTPTAATLSDLTMFNENSGICRAKNSIFKTYDGARTWNEYNLPNSENYINSFCMADSSYGYIITGAGNFLKTSDGGKNWNFVSSFSQFFSQSTKLKFFSISLGFMLNRDGNGDGVIFKTTNGGLNWFEISDEKINNVRDFHFISPTTGFATTFKLIASYNFPIYKTTNGGATWDSISFVNKIYPEKIFFLNENTGFTSGMLIPNSYLHRTLRTTNGGLTWGDTLKYKLTEIRFFDSNTGYFINGDSILGKTTNAGSNWNIQKIKNLTINYYTLPGSIFFTNQSTAICVGSLGLNLKTTDGGNSWINYNTSFTSEELMDVEFKDNNTGLIIGWNHCYFRTTNAGQSWSKHNLGGSNTELAAIAYAGANTWYIATYSHNLNNIVYKTTDAGITWDSSRLNLSQVTDFKFLNENTGYGVCKYNYFFKTTNGGINWFINNSVGSENWNVSFIDENTGYIGGGEQLRKTTNGGITFDTIPQSVIKLIWDVEFLSRDTIIASGRAQDSPNGAVWRSTNGGNNWVQNFVTNGSWETNIEFADTKTGYLFDGSKTTNGGVNWFRIKMPEGQMWSMNFVDPVTGYAVGKNGVITKTTDGGASTFINNNTSVLNSFSLYQNYPNPFNPTTKIKFDLPRSGIIKIIIFDILGRKMETLLDENLQAGAHEINWNASNYGAGVYFYMLLTDDIKETRKMILIK